MLVNKDRTAAATASTCLSLLLQWMYWAIHIIYVRKFNFVVTYIDMNSSNMPFYKGIPGFTRQTNEIAAHDAESSVYYWWWAFMRLSPVFWYARTYGVRPTDPQIAAAYELVGDMSDANFARWWLETGSKIFAEANRPAVVRLIDIDNTDRVDLYEKSVLVEIPLTIRKATILKQVKDLLNEHHQGRGLDLASTSQAALKLHTKRYRLRTMEHEYWVLLYRLLYENIETWRIGDRLQIAPHLRVRGVDRRTFPTNASSPFDKLHSLTGRYLYKAKHMLANVERGSFPNAERPQEVSHPLGINGDRNYRAAIGEAIDVPSAWHTWLKDEYLVQLKYEVIRRSRLVEAFRLPGSRLRQRMQKFLDGSSDELA